MKRGELVEVADANERLGIDEAVSDLKQRLNFMMQHYNYWLDGDFADDSRLAIIGYTVTFNHNGQASLEVETAGGDPLSEELGKQYLMNIFSVTPDAFQKLILAILDAHDDEYGNLLEYRHSVIIESGVAGGQYRIESPDQVWQVQIPARVRLDGFVSL